MVAPSGVKEKPKAKRRVEGDRERAPHTMEFPGLIDDDVEGGRVIRELSYVLPDVNDKSLFVDNLVDAANDYGGPDYRRTIEFLDGRGAYTAEEIVSGLVFAAAAFEGLLYAGEKTGVASGVLPEVDYPEELRDRFGSGDKMQRIVNRLNCMSKKEVMEFLDLTRDKKKTPVKILYDILAH